MTRHNTLSAPVRAFLLALAILVPVGCSGGATAATSEPGTGNGSAPGTQEPDLTLPTEAPPPDAALPADPCAPTIAAIESLGWAILKTEAGAGPGGPNTQCTFGANRADTTYESGWVAYIPASQMPLEYRDKEVISGVGVEAFRGSPQSGEILATGASPGFRLFVASGDKAALELAKALVAGS